MNFSNLVSSKKHSQIKKQVMVKKAHNLLLTNELVLFFHYNGLKEYNWQQIKEIIHQRVDCKSLLLKSNLSPFIGEKGSTRGALSPGNGLSPLGGCTKLHIRATSPGKNVPGKPMDFPAKKRAQEQLEWHSLIKGPTLLVACSSVEQLAILIKTCAPPTFLSLGGMYKKLPVNHLDIKRLALLGNNSTKVYPALLQTLMGSAGLLLLLQSPGALFASALNCRLSQGEALKKNGKN